MQATWEGTKVSTRRGLALTLIALLRTACASTHVTESDRLRAQAAYERGLTHLKDRQPAPALAALKEAVGVDPGVAEYHDTLGLVLSRARPARPGAPRVPEGRRDRSEVGRRPLPPRDRVRRDRAMGGRGRVVPQGPGPADPGRPRLRPPEPRPGPVSPASLSGGRELASVCAIPRPTDAGRLLQLGPRPGRRESKRRGQGRVPAGASARSQYALWSSGLRAPEVAGRGGLTAGLD